MCIDVDGLEIVVNIFSEIEKKNEHKAINYEKKESCVSLYLWFLLLLTFKHLSQSQRSWKERKHTMFDNIT